MWELKATHIHVYMVNKNAKKKTTNDKEENTNNKKVEHLKYMYLQQLLKFLKVKTNCYITLNMYNCTCVDYIQERN